MTGNTEQDKSKQKLTLGTTKLTLSGIKGGNVPQSLSGGRKNDVKVEVKRKRRTFIPGQTPEKTPEENIVKQQTINLGGLTVEERDARLKVLQQAAEDERKRNEEEKIRIKEREEQEKIRREQEEAEALERAKINAAKEEKQSLVKPIKTSDKIAVNTTTDESFDKKANKKDRDKDSDFEKAPAKPVRSDNKRRSNKLTIAQALNGDFEEKTRSLASVRRAREKARRLERGDDGREKEKIFRDVIIPEVITVQELANRMAERAVDVTKILMKMGMMATANQTIDADTAELIVSEFGHKPKRVTEADVEDVLLHDASNDEGKMEPRAPVVTFMGHVDHGKTSLLDAIRKAKVAEGEAGGITQHIGAYQVKTDSGEKITFLDTPGHEAFTEMRKRGANATDVVVLVVAADDGIMAQTIEALNHAKAAEVPIIVAVNKIDKPGADAQRVKSSLLEHGLVSEEFGGDVQIVEVSAKTGQNLDRLLEAILLQSEILELQANPHRSASGIVVEASVDKNRGVVATILVQTGTLRIGDILVAGNSSGRVRAMNNAEGMKVSEATPSVPVEILGLNEAPEAGSLASVVQTEKQAREISEYRIKRSRDLKVAAEKKGSLEELFLQAREGGIKELPIVIKADVQGSAEAIIGSLQKLANDEVKVKILHSAAGGITSSDISLAGASHAIVVGFNVRADASAKELAAKDRIEIRYYSIIYDLIDDIKAMLSGMLAPEIKEKYLGLAEIREIFNMSKAGKVAGCYVTEGIIKRGAGVRLLRDNVVIHEGKLKTLKRFKDDVKEVSANFECGMAFENYEDIKSGDVIEAFELIEHARSL